jgi:hypothetical protein
MSKKDYGECVGTCSVCTINLWSCNEGKPVIWPCNIAGCPYEKADTQNARVPPFLKSLTGSGLGQIV